LFHVNLSKTGISTSIGAPGATLNIPVFSTRKRNPAVTVGLPGSGLSYRHQFTQPREPHPGEPRSPEFIRTIHNATPEKTEAALAAVKQAAAMVGRTPTISEPHDVDVSKQTMLKIRCRGLKDGTEYQVVDRMTREVVSRHPTLEEAQQYIATHVHVKQIDVTLGLPSAISHVAAEPQQPEPPVFEKPQHSAFASFLVFAGIAAFVGFWMFLFIHF
jgi:hypothetical protein